MSKIARFSKFSDTLFSVKNFKMLSYSSNSSKYYSVMEIMKKIIKNDLTKRQKECLTMYYNKNLNIIKISKILGICPSTVWRHIKISKQKIKKIIKYYHNFWIVLIIVLKRNILIWFSNYFLFCSTVLEAWCLFRLTSLLLESVFTNVSTKCVSEK